MKYGIGKYGGCVICDGAWDESGSGTEEDGVTRVIGVVGYVVCEGCPGVVGSVGGGVIFYIILQVTMTGSLTQGQYVTCDQDLRKFNKQQI